ncbi:MAG: glycosyltransferase, partial [Acidobacteriota bacterium]
MVEATSSAASGADSVRVSVVVPLYNGERFIGECIESALAQSLGDLEVLVVDDGSRDGSAEIVERYVAQDPRARLLQHPDGANRGVSRSRELAITQARGEYVALLDADDVFEPGKLERQVAELEGRPQCVLCHTGIHQVREADADEGGLRGVGNFLYDRLTERNYRLQRSSIEEYQLLDRQDAFQRNWICNSSVMIRAQALRGLRIGFPQLYQVEDWALWIHLALRGPFLLLPEPLVRWRRHTGQATLNTDRDRLRTTYARLELLLYLLAAVDDAAVRRRVEAELPEAL